MVAVAIAVEHKGEYEKALSLVEECFEKRKQVLGQDHPDTKWSEDMLRSWRLEGAHSNSFDKNVNVAAAGKWRTAKMIPRLFRREQPHE